jgi:ABC-2 type transport system permease protein
MIHLDRHVYWEQFRRSLAIVKKNIRIYYSKGPVITFGLLIPFFLFLSFYIGRSITIESLIPGLLGITIFFTASSVGPAIVPWEARSKTLERLISCPISIWTIFVGDMLSSFLFGAIISIFPVIIGLLVGAEIANPLLLALAIPAGAFCFASLGVLMSAYPPTDVPATIMMLSSLIKFPLVFISGIFIPIAELPDWGRIVSSFSPLTYFTDLATSSIQGYSYYPYLLDLAAVLIFAVIFLVSAVKLHERTIQKRL